MDLRIQIEQPDQVLHMYVSGELDAVTAGQITEAAAAFEATKFPEVILDLAGVAFCDGAGLGAILALHQHLTRAGGQLRLHRARAQMRQLLQITGCQTLLDESAEPALGPPRGHRRQWRVIPGGRSRPDPATR